MKRKSLAVMLMVMLMGLVCLFAMAGCSSDQPVSQTTTNQSESQATTDQSADDPGTAVPSGNSASDIGEDKAGEIALKDAGLTKEDAERFRIERDRDNGHFEYEIEFVNNEKEYDYTIDAATGDILEKSVESIFD